MSLVGPHRDELDITLAGLPARTHASQGEQRTLALALRLAAARQVAAVLDTPPLLLLDDVLSELDDDRAAGLLAHLPPGQTLITTATGPPRRHRPRPGPPRRGGAITVEPAVVAGRDAARRTGCGAVGAASDPHGPPGPRGWARRSTASWPASGRPPASSLEVVERAWPDLVGPAAAEALRPVAIRDGRLVVTAVDPVWSGQARWLEGAVVEGLERLLGPGVVTALEARAAPAAGAAEAHPAEHTPRHPRMHRAVVPPW